MAESIGRITELEGVVVNAMQQRASDHSWRHQPILYGSYDRSLYSLESIYYCLRRSGVTPNELQTAAQDMQAIRKRFRNCLDADICDGSLHTKLAYDIVDLYADMSDQLLNYRPVPKGLSRAKQVEHVLRSTRGQSFNHNTPDCGEFGVIAIDRNQNRSTRCQVLVFDDGSVFNASSNIYAYDPGTVGARLVIRRLIINAEAGLVDGTEDLYKIDEFAKMIRPNATTLPAVVDDSKEFTNAFVVAWVRNQYNRTMDSYKHPGQAVAAVRSDLQRSGVDLSNWKRISRLDPCVVDTIIGYPEKRNHTATIFNAIAKYQVQNPSNEQIMSARRILGRSPGQIMREARSQWERVVALVLRYDGNRDDEQRENEWQVADYVRSQIDRAHGGRPITSTTWGGLVKASNLWHQDRVHVEMQRRIGREAAQNQGMIRTWNSLIPAQEIASMQVSPMVSILDLYREGRDMRNCVGSYGDQCHSGRSRIFSIRGSDRTAATVELQRIDSKWVVSQVKGMLNAKVSPEVTGIAKEIAKLYQNAWDDTRQDERNRGSWIPSPAIPDAR